MPTRDTVWPAGTPCWVDCGFDDLDRARRFYGHLLGWDTDEGDGPGRYTICLKNGRPAAGISANDETGAGTFWATYFATDDVEATAAAVREAGGEVVMEPADVGPGRMAIFTDPTGASFSAWQGGDITGVQVYGEPGTLAWNDLLTRDLETAKTFYAAVFGYTYEAAGDDYVTFTPPGADRPAGGMHVAAQLPDDAPPSWLVHFAVADRDSTVSLAEMEDDVEVLMSFDTPFGPEATLRGQEGEVFNVIALADDAG